MKLRKEMSGFPAISRKKRVLQGDFDAVDSLIKRGYDAAMLIFDDLRMLADSINTHYGISKRVELPKVDSVLLTGFEVEGMSAPISFTC